MGFPNEKELEKIRKESEQWEGSLALNSDATPLEKFRFQICQELLLYKQKNNLKNIALAEKLEMPEADLSRILRHRIEGISTDRLLGLLNKINPNHEIHLRVS